MEKEIIRAAKSGDLEKLEGLLSTNPKLTGARDTDGSTPLHCAAWKGHVLAVKALLDAGSDVNATNVNDHWGTTALHAAAHSNRPEIVKLLIERGADVHAEDLEGRSPLAHTTYHKANSAAKMLLAYGASH